MVDNKEWHLIGDRITRRLHICTCQRKLKSFVDELLAVKAIVQDWSLPVLSHQYMLIAWLGSLDLIEHGSNIEHAWLADEEFWEWLETIKDSPNLEDN